ncbi:MAG: hypothetical protein WC781_03270 [Candidatus Pacearchaeota archaeon]|jgi:hypothetical protein
MPALYIGGDESNNGHIPEIHSAVFSYIQSDIAFGDFPKIRDGDYKWDLTVGKNRWFRFLINSNRRNSKSNKDLIGRIYGSLLYEEISPDVSEINFYIDGHISNPEKNSLLGIVSEVSNLSHKYIKINFGPHYDERISLVNKADKIANYLFRKKTTLETLSQDSRIKPLLSF